MNADERRYQETAQRIIGSVLAVPNELGCGFPQEISRNTMINELGHAGFKAEVHQLPPRHRHQALPSPQLRQTQTGDLPHRP